MDTRLPRWVWIGSALLAAVAGMVNVVGYIGFSRQAITHLTGTTSMLGASLARADLPEILRTFGGIAAFVTGAMLSGLIIQDSRLRLGRRYGVALAIESVLLLAAVPLFDHQSFGGPLLAAMACGLQNAMATTYSGAAVRTSHLTGMYTDLGIGFGHALRGLPVPRTRLAISAVVMLGFCCGGGLGALLFDRIGYHALFVPALLTGLVGAGYTLYRHHHLPGRDAP